MSDGYEINPKLLREIDDYKGNYNGSLNAGSFVIPGKEYKRQGIDAFMIQGAYSDSANKINDSILYTMLINGKVETGLIPKGEFYEMLDNGAKEAKENDIRELYPKYESFFNKLREQAQKNSGGG